MRIYCLGFLLAVLVCCPPLKGAPRPVSPAEAAAAEAVCDFLARGAEAFYSRLASDAFLRLLPHADALHEIEARVGEPAGAGWTLRTAKDETAVFEVSFPSGLDELVTFDMKDEGGSWKIAGLRILVELTEDQRKAAAELAADERKGSKETPATGATDTGLPSRWFSRVASLGIAALILAIVGAAIRHHVRKISSMVLLLAFVMFGVQFAIAINPGLMSWSRVRAVASALEKPTAFVQLRSLLPLRRAMIRGESLPATHAGSGELTDVAGYWRAQATGKFDPEKSGTSLSATPLFSLLKARSQIDSGHRDQGAAAYREFRKRVGAPDAFWSEVVMSEPIGHDTNLIPENSRDAGTYYLLAMDAIVHGGLEEARDQFRQAWRMQPGTRADVVRIGFFAPLLRDPMVAILINLNSPEESRNADIELGRKPIMVPAAATASASGAFVRIELGGQRLDIPGGADIAPRGTQIVPATEWERREEATALRDFDSLAKSTLSTPGARLRADATAAALAKHYRWADVLKLTDGINTDAETVPLLLAAARVQALLRLGKNDEARRLAKTPAIGRSMQENGRGVGTLVDLAELLTRAGDYDGAIDTYKKVEGMKHGPDIAPRIRQVDLRRSLAVSTPVVTTAHFEIHCMPDVPPTVAERVGQLLEAELTRVTTHITLPVFKPVRVNILQWTDFSTQLTGSADILGFFDGDITIPFGGVESFRQEVVAILTHEMTHAVITQASDDNAPRWFQEGLAQRMELTDHQANVFEHHTPEQVPALAVLDAEHEAGADLEAVLEAYDEGATFMRFLEDRYGAASLNEMIAAFRNGRNTDEAFLAVTKKNTVEIDREFRAWGQGHREAFVDKTPWPYLRFYSLGIDPKVLESIHWSRRPAVKP